MKIVKPTSLEKATALRLVLAKQQGDNEMFEEALYALTHDPGEHEPNDRLALVIHILATNLALDTFTFAGDGNAAIERSRQDLAAIMADDAQAPGKGQPEA
jgi:hypothetical protein